MKVSISHSRVYLIDFEIAVRFPVGCPLNERVSVGFPVAEKYARPHAPELGSGIDIWQLGYSFSDFKVWHSIILYLLAFSSQSTIPTVARNYRIYTSMSFFYVDSFFFHSPQFHYSF